MCVCTIHQNTKLIVEAFASIVNNCIKKLNKADENYENVNTEPREKFQTDYRTLMKLVVCDIENMECMTHRCESCPGFNALQTYIEKNFEEFDIEDDISYTQWDSTDHTTLNTMTSSVEEFIELLVYRVDNLTTHSFIAKSQARYLKQRKENIDRATGIVLAVQDEVQG